MKSTKIKRITEIRKADRNDPRKLDKSIYLHRDKGKRFLNRLRNGFSFQYFRFVFLLNIENRLGYTTYDIEEAMSKVPGYNAKLTTKFRRKNPMKDYTLDNMEWSNQEDLAFLRFLDLGTDYEFYANMPFTWFEFKIIFQKNRMVSKDFVAYTFNTLTNSVGHKYTLFIHKTYFADKKKILNNFLSRYYDYFSEKISIDTIEFSKDIRPILGLSTNINNEQHREDLTYLFGRVIHNPDPKAHPYRILGELSEEECSERYNNRDHWRFRVLRCECTVCGEILYQPYYQFLRNILVKCHHCYGSKTDKRSKLLSISSGIVERCRNVRSNLFYKYGGRGIRNELGKIASEVADSLDKLPGFKFGYQIDRIDNNGNYTLNHPVHGTEIWYDNDGRPCRGNLRWVDRHTNSSNTMMQDSFSIKDFSLRLMKHKTFLRKAYFSNLNPADFIRFHFMEIKDNRFKRSDYSVYLYVHKSLISESSKFINRIVNFYREFDKNKIYRLDDTTIIKEETFNIKLFN